MLETLGYCIALGVGTSGPVLFFMWLTGYFDA